MQKAKFFIMRHGETTANRDNILQGHSDFPLTDLGVAQAEKCGITLKAHTWDVVFSSDLPRAFNTARIILNQAESLELSDVERIKQSHLLREINFGVREGLSRSLNKEQARCEVARRLGIQIGEVIDTSECSENVRQRQIDFMAHLKEQCAALRLDNNDKDNTDIPKVLCVSHGGFIKDFLRNFLPTVATPAKIGNCSVSIIDIEWCETDASEGESCVFRCTAHPEQVNISVEQD